MNTIITEMDVDRRIAEQDARRKTTLPLGIRRALARNHLELTATKEPGPSTLRRQATALAAGRDDGAAAAILEATRLARGL